MNNHIKVVKLLLGKEETKVNDKNNQGLTPLQVAKYKGHTAIAELLTKKIPLKD
ncbi:hypothetical protein Aasi_1928 [Candidatus Amoebophilus asiaticus 5a2]|uniref:Uncharacterized protein n=1 Tax=Amoebophilus asiaticus (strain 5a2) TaxID=452471 RepID=C3L498_AMOA5|nr:hypothetical protein Aasi_1928 [Candidatus Amoebophilus asiaticus 5a2]